VHNRWEKAWEKGRSEERAKGFAEGLAEVCVEELARDVIIVLRARGIAVPAAARRRILAQKDLKRLKRWLKKAAVAESVREVIDDAS
jgi:hypothetical protein